MDRWETVRDAGRDVGRWELFSRETWQPSLDLICVPPEHVPLKLIEREQAGEVSSLDLCWWVISVREDDRPHVPGDEEQPRGAVLTPRPEDPGWTEGYWECGVVHWFRNRYLADEAAARAVFERAVELGRAAGPGRRPTIQEVLDGRPYDLYPGEVHLHDFKFHDRLRAGALRSGEPLTPALG